MWTDVITHLIIRHENHVIIVRHDVLTHLIVRHDRHRIFVFRYGISDSHLIRWDRSKHTHMRHYKLVSVSTDSCVRSLTHGWPFVVTCIGPTKEEIYVKWGIWQSKTLIGRKVDDDGQDPGLNRQKKEHVHATERVWIYEEFRSLCGLSRHFLFIILYKNFRRYKSKTFFIT